jgi:hypothetical protein
MSRDLINHFQTLEQLVGNKKREENLWRVGEKEWKIDYLKLTLSTTFLQ